MTRFKIPGTMLWQFPEKIIVTSFLVQFLCGFLHQFTKWLNFLKIHTFCWLLSIKSKHSNCESLVIDQFYASFIWQHCIYVPYFKSTKVINVFFFQERLFFLVFFEWKQIFANSTNTQKRAKSLTQSLTPKLWRPTNNWRQKATTFRSRRGEGGRRRTVCDKGRRLRTSTVKVRAPSWSAPFLHM